MVYVARSEVGLLAEALYELRKVNGRGESEPLAAVPPTRQKGRQKGASSFVCNNIIGDVIKIERMRRELCPFLHGACSCGVN